MARSSGYESDKLSSCWTFTLLIRQLATSAEFFLHLFTITIGLLIAVGIEAAVERHQHRELALRGETDHDGGNSQECGQRRPTRSGRSPVNRDRMTENLAGIRKIQLNPNDPSANDLHLDLSYNTTGLEGTGVEDGAGHRRVSVHALRRSRRSSAAFTESEQTFLKAEDQLYRRPSSFSGHGPEVSRGERGKLSKEAADGIAEQLGICQGHLLTLKIAAVVLQEQQNAFLEGREGPKSHTNTSPNKPLS